MGWDDLGRMADEENKHFREKWIGVYIGVLAVMLAICSMGGGNAAKEATLKNIAAANTWSFFQAKNMRRHVLRLQADELELRLATLRWLAVKAALHGRIVGLGCAGDDLQDELAAEEIHFPKLHVIAIGAVEMHAS